MKHTQCYYCHGVKDVKINVDAKACCIYCRGEKERYSRTPYYLPPNDAVYHLRGQDFKDGLECRFCRKQKTEWTNKRKKFYCSETCYKKFWEEEYFPHFVWTGIRNAIYKRDGGQCVFCHQKLFLQDAQIDHIIAIVNNGDETDYNNLRTLCKQCHSLKTKEDIIERKRFLKKDIHGEQQQKLFGGTT